MTQKRHFGTRSDPQVVAAINQLVDDGFVTPATIVCRLIHAGFPSTDIPSSRTIQRIVSQRHLAHVSEEWSTTANADVDPALVLPFLGEVIRRTRGRIDGLRLGEALWIQRLHPLFIDAEASKFAIFVLARAYAEAEHTKRDVRALDQFVAFQPWSDGHAYLAALDAGWVELPPLHVLNRFAIGGPVRYQGEEIVMWDFKDFLENPGRIGGNRAP